MDSYLFTLADTSYGYFDPLDYGNYNTQWTLRSESGEIISSRLFYQSDGVDYGDNVVRRLDAGTYQLDISKTSTNTGTYNFRLLDLATATAISVGDTVSATLDPASGTAAYRFTGSAGQKIEPLFTSESGASYTAYGRIVDAYGNDVARHIPLYDPTAVTLPADGDYWLLIEGRVYNALTQVTNYTLNLREPIQSVGAAQIGDRLAGTLFSRSDTARWTVTVDEPTQLVVDGLIKSDYVTLRIVGDGIDRSFDLGSLGGGAGTSPFVELGAGTFNVIVTSNRYSARDFDVRLIDAIAAPTIALDTSVSSSLVGGETDVYRFDATAGQVITIGDVTNNGPQYDAYIRILDQYGNTIYDTQYLQNSGQFTLPRDGTYTVLIESHVSENPANTTAYAFTLIDPRDPEPVAIVSDELVEGSIERPGQVVRYTIEVLDDAILFPDSFIRDSGLYFTIRGPEGFYRQFRSDNTDSADNGSNIAMPVVPGTYTVEVSRTSGATGAFAFALRDKAAGTPVAFDTLIEGTLDPRLSTRVYLFDAEVGDRFAMDAIDYRNFSYQPYWRLIDPIGGQEIGVTALNDRGIHTLQRTGTYALLIEGRVRDSAIDSGTITFRLQSPTTYEVAGTLANGADFDGLEPAEGPGGSVAQGFTGFERIEMDGARTDITGNQSFELWFRPDNAEIQAWTPLVYKGTGASANTRQMSLWLNNSGYLHFGSSDSSGQITVNTASSLIPYDEWTHVVGVVDRTNDQLRLYVNGVEAASAALRDGQTSVDVAEDLLLGGSRENDQGFRGAMSGFRLWDSALTAENAAALYAGTSVPAGTIVDLAMNDAPGAATLADRAGDDAVVHDFGADMQGAFRGRFDQIGEVAAYTFTLDAAKTLYWDNLHERSDIDITLIGPDGLRIERRHDYAGDTNDTGNYVFEAPAGDYRLTFTPVGTARGAYGIRLLDLADATPITADGSVVETTFRPDRSAQAFVFDGTAGQQVYVDVISSQISANESSWRLIDPFGRQVYGPVTGSDVPAQTLQFDGTYALVLESDPYVDQHSNSMVSFALVTVNTEPVDITVGGPNPVPEAARFTNDALGGQAVRLHGSEYWEVANDPALDQTGSLTLEAWVKLDRATDSWMTVLSKGGDPDTATYQMMVSSNGALWFGAARDASSAVDAVQSGGGVVGFGEWVHIAGVVNRTTNQMLIYANGGEVGSRSYTYVMESNADPLLIGRSKETNTSYGTFEGAIDEVRLWSVARSAAEIAAARDSLLAGNEAGLELYLPFDDATGGIAPDVGPNSLDAAYVSLVSDGVTGEIENAGEVRTYLFSLTEEAQLIVDSQTYNTSLLMRLTGNQGTIFDRSFNQLDSADLNSGAYRLEAGDYRIEVYGSGSTTGAYNFRLLDLATADALTLGEATSGSLAPSNATDLYSFDAVEGQRYFFDVTNRVGDIYWRVLDPFGQQVVNNATNDTTFAAAFDGTYTIAVEGRINSGGESVYDFAVHEIQPAPPEPLNFGLLTYADIRTPGDAAQFSFTLTQDTIFALDSLIYDGGVYWTLTGPDGNIVNARPMNQTDAQSDTSDGRVQRLGAGDYILSITASGDRTGQFEFKALDVAGQAAQIFFNDRTVDTLPNEGKGTAIYYFDAEKGDRITPAVAQSPDNNYTYWRLLNENGYQVQWGGRLIDETPIDVPETGRYYFVIENWVNRTTSTAYDFELLRPLREDATDRTLEDFEVGAGIPYVLVDQGAFVETGLGNNRLILLQDLDPGRQTQIAFDRTATGRHETISMAFDFEITGPASGLTGEGFSAILTGVDGPTGLLPFAPVEPDLAGRVAAALDLVQTSGDGAVPHLSLHYGGKLTEVDLSSFGITLADIEGAAGHFEISLARADGGAVVSVVLTLDGVAYTAIDGFFIGGLELADMRGAIQAQATASDTMQLAIDNVEILVTGAVTAPALTLGALVEGDIAVSSEVDRWSFSLADPTRLAMDILTDNSNLYWQLQGPVDVGEQRFTSSDSYDRSGNPLFDLASGDYTLVVYSKSSAVGSYGLRLFDPAAEAQTLVPEVETVGTLSPGNETQVYKLDWATDGSLYLQSDLRGGSSNVYWKLTTLDGTVLIDRTGIANDATVSLAAGSYYLFVEGRRSNSSDTSFAITARRATQTDVAIATDEVVTGTVDPFESEVLTFSLAADTKLVLDSRTNRSDLFVRLEGPEGTILSGSRINQLDSNLTNVLLAAPAGDYKLTVYGSALASGDYELVVLNVADAEALSFGQTVTADFDPQNSSHIWRFDGAAGDSFYLDAVTAFSGNWKILDQYGQTVMSNRYVGSDFSPVTLAADGPHYLIVDGYVYATGTATQSFRLIPLAGSTSATALGQRETGEITLPGESQSYSFSLNERKLVYVDVQGQSNGNFRWRLDGFRGTYTDRAFTQSDGLRTGSPPIYTLEPGDYTFTVYANNANTGGYAFQILDMDAAEALTLGTAVSDTLAPGQETRIYAFDGTAGDRFFFDNTQYSNYSTYWRLIDPYGREMWESYLQNDVDTTTLTETGRHYVLIEGDIYNGNDAPFAFNIYANPISSPVILRGLEGEPVPDLTVTDVTIDTTDPILSGGPLPVTWTVNNQGDAAVTTDFETRVTVRRQDTGQVLADVVVPYSVAISGTIEPSAAASGQVTLTLPPGLPGVGELTVTVRADVGNAIEEANLDGTAELNNAGSVGVTSELAPYVDLVTEYIMPVPADGFVGGEAVTVGWTVRNAGTAAAEGAFTERLEIVNVSTGLVVFSRDWRRDGSEPIAAGAGISREVVLAWPEGVDGAGQFEFRLTQDVLGELFETNLDGTAETNNHTVLSVANAPDLKVSAIAVEPVAPLSGGRSDHQLDRREPRRRADLERLVRSGTALQPQHGAVGSRRSASGSGDANCRRRQPAAQRRSEASRRSRRHRSLRCLCHRRQRHLGPRRTERGARGPDGRPGGEQQPASAPALLPPSASIPT